ncbi:DegV family EDD domain-containing protein [bacterium]|nr:DegV family EDD domain-containing protein [bacterium]
MKLKRIDGEKLYFAFLHGSREVERNRRFLDRINVFPVPDGDTGTNLAATLNSTMLGSSSNPSVAAVSKGFADAALAGSRGNSGIILAQFIRGLSEAMQDKEALTAREFAHAVRSGVDRAYHALSKPVEGTILTVMKAWSNALHAGHEKMSDFNDLMHHSLESARKALKETPKQLKKLEEAGVVDAGAQGFVHFLEGITHFVKHGKKAETPSEKTVHENFEDIHPVVSGESITQRYCCEMFLSGNGLKPEVAQVLIEDLGDSLVVSGTQERLKIHIHTNDPSKIYERLGPLGAIQVPKIDDMKRQFEAVHRRAARIALVTDTSCDLPLEVLDRYQIHIVPLHLNFGKTEYLDKVAISPDQFYAKAETSPDFPKTSQPAVQQFAALYRFLAEHYDSILSVHLSSGLSGTFQAAKTAAESLKDARISVIDSRNLSLSLALIVERMARILQEGCTHEHALDRSAGWIRDVRVYVTVPTLKYLMRGGRISHLKGAIANTVRLKPIISLDEYGKASMCGKAFNHEGQVRKIIGFIRERHHRLPVENYIVASAGAREKALDLEDRLIPIIGKRADHIVDVSPAIGSHAGLGAIAVAIL